MSIELQNARIKNSLIFVKLDKVQIWFNLKWIFILTIKVLTENELINSIHLVKPYCYNLWSIHNGVKLSTCFCILKAFVSFPTDWNLLFLHLERSIFIRAVSKLPTRIFVLKYYQRHSIGIYVVKFFIHLFLIERSKMDLIIHVQEFFNPRNSL
jgi:hypothetical protein